MWNVKNKINVQTDTDSYRERTGDRQMGGALPWVETGKGLRSAVL